MNSKKIIPVVTASDENYAPYLSVMIRSVLEKCDQSKDVYFYVIDDGITEASKEKLKETVKSSSEDANIYFLTTDKEVYEDFLVSDHITTTAYLRISLPELLEEYHYEKVLYVDSDTLVLSDITELYDEDLEGKVIGAVIDPGQAKALGRLGIDSDDYYFNSGVMLVDLKKWREQNITQKTIQYLRTNGDRIIYHDQDALNAVLYENWKSVHPKWNMQSSLIFNKHKAPNETYERLYKEGNEAPAIVHFTGHDKPWNTLEYHPYKEIYLEELSKSKLMKVGIINE
ncbi:MULTISPECIES: glycosyltransferase family 8 protein [unclassified Enterococcus]|jgi:lipopolysaccharide biosynthesis glycosyltransferase|uniref:glycosyltransferase family 8 protein n=1 Tax=unclassified Enterococcus TaxID=2608891 RepID=UPI0003549543|nr:putative general stress protein A [Enterococcus faecalis 13-SD-W-01]